MADYYEESIDKLSLYNELLIQENSRLEKIIELLKKELEESKSYADRLAAGLPEGMLPKDIENMKQANLSMAEEILKLQQTKREMKLQLDLTVDLADQRWKELDKLKRQYSFDRYTIKYGEDNVD